MHGEAAGLQGEEQRRADQQQGDRRVRQQEPVERLFRIGLEHRQREQLATALGVLLEQQPGDVSGLVRYPVAQAIVQADIDRILAQRGAGDGGVTQIGHQHREVTAIGLPGLGGVLQGFKHAGRRAGDRRRRGGWA